MLRLARVLFGFLFVIGGQMALAEAIKGPWVSVGVGHEDPTGDSPYGPLNWCGDLLWAEHGTDVVLIEPETKQVRWTLREMSSQDFVACNGEQGLVVVWTSTNHGLAWRTLDDKQLGLIFGVARDRYRGRPLISFIPGATIIVAEHQDLQSINSPPGNPIVSLPASDLSAIVGDVDPRCASSDPPILDWAYAASSRLLVLGVDRTIPDRDALYGCALNAATTLVSMRIDNEHVVLDRHWKVNEGFDPPISDSIYDVENRAGQQVQFSVGWPQTQTCNVDLASKEPHPVCAALPPRAYKYGVVHAAIHRIFGAQVGSTQISPSGEWVAWTEAAPTEEDYATVNMYLARTADLLVYARRGSAGWAPE